MTPRVSQNGAGDPARVVTGPLVTDDVFARVVAVHGDAGTAWLDGLPATLERLTTRWALEPAGSPFPGASTSLVLPVRRDGEELVLKLAPSVEWLGHEARVLAHWDGNGAVRLIGEETADAALLIERAVPGVPLYELAEEDDRAATAAAAEVVVLLRSAASADIPALPALASWVDAIPAATTGEAVPELRRECDRAHGLAKDLLDDATHGVVLHGDLHHWNVLQSQREPWLAIDPKGVVGPREAELAALLRNPRRTLAAHPKPVALLQDRLDVLVERLGDDAAHVAAWAYVLAVVAAAWALEDREGPDEVRRWLACATALRETARRRGAG